jgi:hypothetical protein
MTLEEDEDFDLISALPASGRQAGSEKRPPAKTKVQLALTRCADLATVIPIIILLLPVYTLIRVCAATVCIHRFLRGKIHRHTLIPDVCSVIPDVCSTSQNLKEK